MSNLILPKRKVTQIELLSQFDLSNSDFSDVINEHLKNGWRVHGDFVITPNGLTVVLAREIEVEVYP